MKETQTNLQAFRLKCYRQMLLEDIQDDYAIQDYQADWKEAQDKVNKLFHELDTLVLSPEEKADRLLTIFVALQIGYRNDTLFTRAIDMTYDLLPQLAETADFPEAPILKSQLATFLYQETQDEELLPYIDHFMSTMSEDAMSEEDLYIIELFQLTATA